MTKRVRDFEEECGPPLKKLNCEQSIDNAEVQNLLSVLPCEIVSSIYEYLSIEEVINLRRLNIETNELIMGCHGPELPLNDFFQWLPKTVTPQKMAFGQYLEKVSTSQFLEIQIIQAEWGHNSHWRYLDVSDKERILKINGRAHTFSEVQEIENLLNDINNKIFKIKNKSIMTSVLREGVNNNFLERNPFALMVGVFFAGMHDYYHFDLSNMGLTRVPKKIWTDRLNEAQLNESHTNVIRDFFELKKILSLNLSHNKLLAFPHEILNLNQLKKLNLSHNCLTTLPDELFNLNHLTILNLDGNQLSEKRLILVKQHFNFSERWLQKTLDSQKQAPIEIPSLEKNITGVSI